MKIQSVDDEEETENGVVQKKRCGKCKEEKELSEFSPALLRSYGVTVWCRAFMARYKRERYARAKAEKAQRGKRASSGESSQEP